MIILDSLLKYLGPPAAESSDQEQQYTSAALVSSGEFNVSVNVCDDKNVLTRVKMTICCTMSHPVNVFALMSSLYIYGPRATGGDTTRPTSPCL